MKTLILLITFLSAVSSQAQTLVQPRSEFTVSLSESQLTLKSGESKAVVVSVARSKSFARAEAVWGVSSSLPKGITVQYEPAAGLGDSSVATIKAGPEAASGNYTLILNATLRYKTKGSVVKLIVGDSSMAAN